MAYNSNNWETEATLRNQRKAKADSMSALLDHVDWNPETLEISLSGITLKWGDIEGADTVVQYTQIDGENVITKNLKATNLELYGNCRITGGTVNISSYSEAGQSFISLTNTYANKTVSTNMTTLGISVVDSTEKGTWIDDTGITTDYKIFANGLSCQGAASFDSTVTIYGTLSHYDAGDYATKLDLSGYAPSSHNHANSTLGSMSFPVENIYVSMGGGGDNNVKWSSTWKKLYIESSSRRFKENIIDVSQETLDGIHGLYDVSVKEWNYKDSFVAEEYKGVKETKLGVIAEDVADVLPGIVSHDNDGNITDYDNRQLINAMLVLLQEQNERLKALEVKHE